MANSAIKDVELVRFFMLIRARLQSNLKDEMRRISAIFRTRAGVTRSGETKRCTGCPRLASFGQASMSGASERRRYIVCRQGSIAAWLLMANSRRS
jgi:hypothetical protein